MGFRTLIEINNDNMELLTQDPQVGGKIKQASLDFYCGVGDGEIGNLGQVLDVSHTGITKLMVISPFDTETLATASWNADNVKFELLSEAADKLGYRLVKKPTPKTRN